MALLIPAGHIAKPSVEQVPTAQRHELHAQIPLATPTDTHHRRLQIVIRQTPRHAVQELKRSHVSIQKRHLILPLIRPHEHRPAVRQTQTEELQRPLAAPDDDRRLAPIDLSFLSRSEHQRHKHLGILTASRPLPSRHKPLHRRITADKLMLVTQPLEHPLSRMTLFPRPRPIGLQPRLDDRRHRLQHRTLPSHLPPITRRLQMRHRLLDGLPRVTQFLSHFALTQPVNQHLPTNQFVLQHRQHPSIPPSDWCSIPVLSVRIAD